MNQVFISYKSTPKERALAGRLRSALEDEGIKVWMDKALEAGESWEHALQDQLEKTAAIVFLVGPDGRVSEEQRDEATAVFRAEWEKPEKIPLIPVITSETELPPFLKQVPAIEVTDMEKGWSNAAQKIKLSLGTSPSAVAASSSTETSSGESEQQARLLEIQRFADSLKSASESHPKEKLAR